MRKKTHSKDREYLNSKLYLKDHRQVDNMLGNKSYLRLDAASQNKVLSDHYEHRFSDRGTLFYYH